MTHPTEIRAATESDLQAILVLFGALDDVHTAGAPRHFRGSSAAPRDPRLLLDRMRNPSVAFLLAEADAKVVGLACLEIRESPDLPLFVPRQYGHVSDLVVSEEVRRRGIGRALMRAAEQWVRDRGLDSIEVGVWDFNQDAVRLYERLGYVSEYRRLSRSLA